VRAARSVPERSVADRPEAGRAGPIARSSPNHLSLQPHEKPRKRVVTARMGSHSGVVEFLAEGRLAEVFALDERRVLKLDRPEWSGVSDFEFDVLTRLAAAGLPVARAHEVVTVDGRRGVVLDRVQGTSLTSQLVECRGNAAALTELAARFSQLQATINATTVEGLPDLVTRMRSEIAMSDLATPTSPASSNSLSTLDDGQRRVLPLRLPS